MLLVVVLVPVAGCGALVEPSARASVMSDAVSSQQHDRERHALCEQDSVTVGLIVSTSRPLADGDPTGAGTVAPGTMLPPPALGQEPVQAGSAAAIGGVSAGRFLLSIGVTRR